MEVLGSLIQHLLDKRRGGAAALPRLEQRRWWELLFSLEQLGGRGRTGGDVPPSDTQMARLIIRAKALRHKQSICGVKAWVLTHSQIL